MDNIPLAHRSIPQQWLYGDAGNRYPVQTGDLWQVGSHLFACGDIEEGDARRLIALSAQPPLMAVVDPPWSAGNAKAFRTKAGVPRPVDYRRFLSHLLDTLSGTRCCAMMMGRKSYQEVSEMARIHGWEYVSAFPMYYYKTCPCMLLLLSKEDMWLDVPHADEEHVWHFCIASYSDEGTLLFDPCVGRGGTAVIAHRMGRSILGMELHPRRLAVCLDRLAQAGAGIPQKIGSING